MFRHVLCVYPYRIEHGFRSSFYPPLGLEIIAAVLEPHAEKIEVVDLRRELGRTVDFLRPDTDLVCFSINWDREPDFVREEVLSVPASIFTVVGGRHATEDPEKWLSGCPNIRILVRGDGEETIEEIAQGRALNQIAGISYRLDGQVVHGPVRHLRPISEDFSPNRSLRRCSYALEADGFPTLSFDMVVSSRGCPFHCKFCSFNRNLWGEKRPFSARSPESVVRELEEIDAKAVFFADDNFAHDPDRVAAICDLIQARGIRKRFLAQTRAEIGRRPDVVRKMERAGFSMLFFGVESAQDDTLRSLSKGFTTKQLREYFRVLRKSRMLLFGYFILGNIGETENEMREIGPFARELGLDEIYVCPLRNEPYSAIRELVAQNPGYHIGPNGFVYSDMCPPERLGQIRRGIRKDFSGLLTKLCFFWKAYRNGLLSPGMLPRLFWFLLRRAREHRRKVRLKRERSATGARYSAGLQKINCRRQAWRGPGHVEIDTKH